MTLVPVTDPGLLERLRLAREQRDAVRAGEPAPDHLPTLDLSGMKLMPVEDPKVKAKLEMFRSLRERQYAPGPAIQQYLDIVKSGGRPGPGLAELAKAEDQGWFTKYVAGGAGAAAEGFLSAVPATMTLAGGLASKLGISGGEDLAEWGGDVQRYLDEKLSVQDENFYHQVMNGIGSMASFFLPGLGVASMVGKVGSASRFVVGGAEAIAAARAGGAAIKLTKAGSLLQKGIQLSSMSILESGYEMSDQMRQRMSEGATAEQAFGESQKVFWYNLPVLMATNAGYFSPAGLAARVALEAVSEGGQERFQALVQDVVAGRGKWSDFFADKYWAETGVGALLGAGFAPLIGAANKERGGTVSADGTIKPPTGPGFQSADMPEGFETFSPPGAAGGAQTNAAPQAPASTAAPAPVAQRQAQAQPQAAAPAATGVEPQDKPQTLDTPTVQTTAQRRAAEYRARRAGREARKLDFAHARADAQAREMVGDGEFARQRALQALEDGLNEMHGVTFQLSDRLETGQLDELADMAIRGLAHADAFDRTTLAALTVARANEMLFRGSKAGQVTDTRLEFDAILNTDLAPPSAGVVGPTVAPVPVLSPQRPAKVAPAPKPVPSPPPVAAPAPARPAAPVAAPASAVAPEPAPAPPPATSPADATPKVAPATQEVAPSAQMTVSQKMAEEARNDPEPDLPIDHMDYMLWEERDLARRNEIAAENDFINAQKVENEVRSTLGTAQSVVADLGGTVDDGSLLRTQGQKYKSRYFDVLINGQDLRVRVSDHEQPTGGSVRFNPAIGEMERGGDFDVDLRPGESRQAIRSKFLAAIDTRAEAEVVEDPVAAPAVQQTLDQLPEPKGSGSTVEQDLHGLRREMGRHGVTVEVSEPPKGKGPKGVRALAKAFGIEVVYVKATEADGSPSDAFDGAAPAAARNRIFLNLNANTPLLYVAAHEIGHNIQKSDPKAWAEIVKIIQKHSKLQGSEIAKAYDHYAARGVSEQEMFEEYGADIIARAIQSESFLLELKARDQTLFKKLITEIRKVMAAARDLIHQNTVDVSQYFDNFAAVEKAVSRIAADVAVKRTDMLKAGITQQEASEQDASEGSQYFIRFRQNKLDKELKAIDKSGYSPELKEQMRAQARAEDGLALQHRMTLKGRWDLLYTRVVDRTHPLYLQMVASLKSAGVSIQDLPIELNPQRYLERLRGWGAKANMFIHFEVRSLDGKKILSQGLQPIIKKHGIAQAIDDGSFEQFYIAARHVSVHDVRGDAYFGEDPSSASYKRNAENYAKHKTIFDQYKGYKNWMAAVEDFTAYSNAVMSLFADGDPETRMLSPEELAEVLDKYDIYAPLYLLEFAERKMAPGSKRPTVGAGRPLMALGEMVPDAVRQRPISALIKKTYTITHMVDQNRAKIALTEFIKTYGSEGGGLTGIGRRIQPKQRPSFKSGEDLLRALGFKYADHPLYQEYIDGGMTAEEAREFVREDLDRQFADMGIEVGDDGIMNAVGKIWTMAGFQADGTIALMRNGEIEYWQIDPELWDVYMTATGPDNQIMEIFAKQTALLRAGAVLTPEFMGRNVFRDFVSAAVMSTSLASNPIEAAVVPIRIIRGLRHAIKHDDMWKDWIMSGSAHSEMVSYDVDKLRTETEKLTRDYSLLGKSLRVVSNPMLVMKSILPTLQQISLYSEQATRLAVYERGGAKAAKLGLKGEAARLYAMNQARESSIDFGRSGVVGASLNRMIPFFNANVQGLDKVYRTLFRGTKSERAAAWMRASYLVTLPSILLWLSHRDEEWYQKSPGWLKNSCWLISTDGGKNVWAIPKPFEIGMLFGSLPERFLDHMYLNDRKAMDEWAKSVYAMINPVQVHQLAGPMFGAVVEDMTNWDFFQGAHIVKGGLQNLEERDQWTSSTTSIAKVIGEAFPGQGASPLKIDHFIRSSLGGLGMHGAQIASWLYDETLGKEAAKNRPAAPKLWGGLIPSDAPVIGKLARSFERHQPEAYSRNIVEFYEIYDHANKVSASFDSLLKTGADRGTIADRVEQEGEWIGVADIVNHHAKLVSRITAQIRALELDRSQKWTPEQKREMIDKLINDRDYTCRQSVEGILGELEKQRDSIRINLEAAAARIRSGR